MINQEKASLHYSGEHKNLNVGERQAVARKHNAAEEPMFQVTFFSSKVRSFIFLLAKKAK